MGKDQKKQTNLMVTHRHNIEGLADEVIELKEGRTRVAEMGDTLGLNS